VKRLAPAAGPLRAAAAPALMADAERRALSFLGKADHIVAVCHWVREALLINGVAAARITLSRQGVDLPADHVAPPAPPVAAGAPLRIAYFGRIDPTKGPDLLAEALAAAPKAAVTVDVYGVDQDGGAGPAHARLARRAAGDPRLRLKPAVAPDAVLAAMAAYDLIAIPSRWLETGPLVALEAFAAGVPVLGARRGGIAELVRDGVDGVLVAPGDVAAWAAALERLAADPGKARALRAGIRPPRTMDAAAADMAELYERLPAAA
jgi:glycosyltransferase involved in cell wall biosynthesis